MSSARTTPCGSSIPDAGERGAHPASRGIDRGGAANVAIEIAEAVRAALVDNDFSRAVNARWKVG